MKFRTEIGIPRAKEQLEYSSKILSIGSCFALSIGEKLTEAKFNACVNPTGVLFNPCSIVSTLERFEEFRGVSFGDLESRRDQWFHFDFHGSFSSSSPQETLSKINCAVQQGHSALKECDTLIITLGTIWIYRLVENGKVVANCHKEPASRFNRCAMSVSEVVDSLSPLIERYPSKQFIFSVSPVRHLLDGMAENSLSKASLRVAIDQLQQKYKNVAYFPAFEIMMDDLRDYRFYADDMLHPSKKAVEYIWSKFCQAHISALDQETMEKVAAILRAASHRPFNAQSEAYREFCRKQLEFIKEHKNINLSKESDYFRGQLQNNL